jgi:hypothetical protein
MYKEMSNLRVFASLVILSLCISVAVAEPQAADEKSASKDKASQPHSSKTPDMRGSEMKVKFEKGSFVVVPIPLSNPTLDTGLIVGAAYFYRQTEEQKKAQPASVTGAAAMYTSNKSYALGIGQESYWHKDKWRFTGVVGLAKLDLNLLVADGTTSGSSIDWLIEGEFLFAQIARKITGRWYLGVNGRYVDFNQDFLGGLQPFDLGLDFSSESKTVGLGILLERDSRKMPTNPYSGNLFKLSGLFNDRSFGSDATYQSYDVAFSSYHKLAAPVVLAWQVKACQKSGTVPLWDACRVGLRGFAATQYMGTDSALGQVEARWQMSRRWGAVAFAGAGYVKNSLAGLRDQETIPSYGLGLRFMVMLAKRINLRVDYGRSNGGDAWYLSAGEAF